MDAMLQAYSPDEKLRMLGSGLAQGSPVVMSHLESNPRQLKQLQQSLKQEQLMDICRYGSERSMRLLKEVNFNQVENGDSNSCAHEASRYGNMRVLRQLAAQPFANFNRLNRQHQTPLTYSLKHNQHNYEKVALFLLDKTDLSIRDADHRLPFEVNVRLNESRARLIELIEEKYRKQYL